MKAWAGKLIVTVCLGCLAAAACAPAARVTRGTLEGRVSFAPAAPVETEGPPPTLPPQFYEQHSLIIYQSDGSTLVTNVLLDGQGQYRIDLDPATYVVKWRRKGTERANLPVTVTVPSGVTVHLDVQVDSRVR